jgi:hypothetical protein
VDGRDALVNVDEKIIGLMIETDLMDAGQGSVIFSSAMKNRLGFYR